MAIISRSRGKLNRFSEHLVNSIWWIWHCHCLENDYVLWWFDLKSNWNKTDACFLSSTKFLFHFDEFLVNFADLLVFFLVLQNVWQIVDSRITVADNDSDSMATVSRVEFSLTISLPMQCGVDCAEAPGHLAGLWLCGVPEWIAKHPSRSPHHLLLATPQWPTSAAHTGLYNRREISTWFHRMVRPLQQSILARRPSFNRNGSDQPIERVFAYFSFEI